MHEGTGHQTTQSARARRRTARYLGVLLAVVAGVTAQNGLAATRAPRAETGFDWTRYTHDIEGSGFTTDPAITPANAGTLAAPATWPKVAAGNAVVSSQPVVANGLVYWGSWDGVEHATPVSGSASSGWQDKLGTTIPTATKCTGRSYGVAGAPAVGNVTVSGQSQPSTLFVGDGGNDTTSGGFVRVYAIDAVTGTVLWNTPVAQDTSTAQYFIYSSPVLYTPTGQTTPSVYLGLSSVGDPCGLVQGQVVQLNATTGALQHTFNVVPAGCTGGSIWGSPTVDPATNSVFVVTGNSGVCTGRTEPYTYAIVRLNATDITSAADFWAVPKAEFFAPDEDFGSVPLLFTGTITPGGSAQQLVGATNKNGYYYVWKRNDLAAGPVARIVVAAPHAENISPASFDGTYVYVASKKTTVGSVTYSGSLRAFNPNNLASCPLTTCASAPVWTTTFSGAVWAPVTSASGTGSPGIVIAAANHATMVLNASTGAVIKTLLVTAVGTSKGSLFAGPSIANGVLYDGDSLGHLYAYTLGGVAP